MKLNYKAIEDALCDWGFNNEPVGDRIWDISYRIIGDLSDEDIEGIGELKDELVSLVDWELGYTGIAWDIMRYYCYEYPEYADMDKARECYINDLWEIVVDIIDRSKEKEE